MFKFIGALFAFLAPTMSFAQVGPVVASGGQNIFGLLLTGQSFLNVLIKALFVFAIVVIIWGVIKFMMAGGEEAKDGAKNILIYGVLGLFIMTSIWGLVSVLRRSTGVGNGNDPVNIFCIPTPQQPC